VQHLLCIICICTYIHGLLSFCSGSAYSASHLPLRSAFYHLLGVDSASRLASSSFGFHLSFSTRRGGYGVLTAFPTVQLLGGIRMENRLIHFLPTHSIAGKINSRFTCLYIDTSKIYTASCTSTLLESFAVDNYSSLHYLFLIAPMIAITNNENLVSTILYESRSHFNSSTLRRQS